MPGQNTGFQTFVNRELPVGVAGDFAGANIRANVVIGPGAFVAPPGGTTVGAGCWANPVTGICSNYFQPNTFPGFVHRTGQGLITQFLGISTMLIPKGFPVVPMAQGDFWGLFASGASVLQKVYADPVTGALSANATGQSVTVSISAAGASVAASVLTTTDADVSGGALAVGQIVVDSGGNLPPGTYIASAAGTGSGTHLWNLANADGAAIPNVSAGSLTWKSYGVQELPYFVASAVPADASITATMAAPVAPSAFGILTVSAVASGSLAPGQWLSSSGAVPVPLTQNVQIIQQLTGTVGGTGTYLVSNATAVGSGQTFKATQGQLGKISTWSA